MALSRVNELEAFRDFLDRALSNSAGNLALGEILHHWEIEPEPK